MNNNRSYIAEAIGTFALVFIGGGAILSDALTGMGLLGVALAHGLVLMCMVYVFGHISGAHFNPAVTIALWINNQIDSEKALGYIASQLFGSILAAIYLLLVFTDKPGNLGSQTLAPGVLFSQGILIEAILTFFLVFVIYGVAVDERAPKGVYGVAIGMTLAFCILAGGTVSGASLNPARSFGPALISGTWANHLVYWIGPILGGIGAGILYDKVFLKK
ncbi:MAG TPA: MIP family channel protein [Nitrospinae bacterium]|nr:MIP family channel protein [Nitrospinota bacterium]